MHDMRSHRSPTTMLTMLYRQQYGSDPSQHPPSQLNYEPITPDDHYGYSRIDSRRPSDMATSAHMASDPSRDKPVIQVLHRETREHRHLWYQMTVLQQPERARACGAGIKANSDRRPVDPPPVVELRIYEGPSIEKGKHITFDYNANFFLYASLEHARTYAHGRVQAPAANCPPILSGVPASGMAYLDRPAEAGYFIFPDLSVRHEGHYCLNFSLFETTKEKKDYDVNLDPDMPPGVDFRMELKTKPFSVFSAKKFPGLMESTDLSKMVADQGCRVRIRRDVRMRKRDKNNRDYERRDDEYARRRTVTPATEDSQGLRPRSVSNSSEQRIPYPQEPQRRPSLAESYPSAPPPPPGYDSAPLVARSHLGFGGPAGPQYAAPSQYAQPPPPPPLQVAPPVSPSGPYQPTAHSPHIKTDPHYGYHSSRTASQAASPASIKPDYERRHSNAYIPPSPTAYTPTEAHSRRESYSSYPATPVGRPQLPRLQMKPTLPPPMAIASLVTPDAPIEAQTEHYQPPPAVPTGAKRKLDHVFIQSNLPLYNGQRQVDLHYEDRSRFILQQDPSMAHYNSADGSLRSMAWMQYESR